LADAVNGLLASPEKRMRLGQHGRTRAQACFGLERQVAEMSDVYRRALAT
jgi:glycosyltransferase involved in cell wall biosynthesis